MNLNDFLVIQNKTTKSEQINVLLKTNVTKANNLFCFKIYKTYWNRGGVPWVNKSSTRSCSRSTCSRESFP
jgi:hypothetical protein